MGRSSNRKWQKRKTTTGLNREQWKKFIKVKHATTMEAKSREHAALLDGNNRRSDAQAESVGVEVHS